MYARWSSQTTVILPNGDDRVGYTLGYTGDLTGDFNRDFILTVTPAAGYTVIDVSTEITDVIKDGDDYKFKVVDNVPIHIKVQETSTGKQTESSDTTLNYDNGSKTDVRTVAEKDNSGTSTITVKSVNTKDDVVQYESVTEAIVTQSSATVTITTTDDESAEAS